MMMMAMLKTYSLLQHMYIGERYVSVHLFLLQLEYYRMQGVLEVRWTCDRHKQRVAIVTKNEKYILNCLIVFQWCRIAKYIYEIEAMK